MAVVLHGGWVYHNATLIAVGVLRFGEARVHVAVYILNLHTHTEMKDQ